MPCDIASKVFAEPAFEWILEARSRPLQAQATVDPAPTVWMKAGAHPAVVGSVRGRGTATRLLPMTTLSDMSVAEAEPSTCCQSREVLVTRTAFRGSQAVIHDGVENALVEDLRRLRTQTSREVPRSREAMGFQMSHLELSGFLVAAGVAYALWRGEDGFVHGFERVASLRDPGYRQVAERIVANGERQALLVLDGKRAVGFASPPAIRPVLGASLGIAP